MKSKRVSRRKLRGTQSRFDPQEPEVDVSLKRLFLLGFLMVSCLFTIEKAEAQEGNDRASDVSTPFKSCQHQKATLHPRTSVDNLVENFVEEMIGRGLAPTADSPAMEKKKKKKGKKGKKSKKSKKSKSKHPPKEYDPNTKVYLHAYWFRACAEDCPQLFLKEQKETMTLEEADQAGALIGRSGMKGNKECCFLGYQRKHPVKKPTSESLVWRGEKMKWCFPGCHRGSGFREHLTTLEEAEEQGGKMCQHCIGQDKVLTGIPHKEEWPALVAHQPFTPPEGWTPKAFSPDALPSKEEMELVIQQVMGMGTDISEDRFERIDATLEHFQTRRFFFPQRPSQNMFLIYRVTGDKRLLDAIRVSARHYNWLASTYPDAGALKASNPEGLAFINCMAIYSRLILQNAVKVPSKVSKEEVDEAETFLKTIITVLKPTYEKDEELDPEFGIPTSVAEMIRVKIFNRGMNGIGAMAASMAALQDLQTVRETTEYQPTIDHYRKTVQAYIKNWRTHGNFVTFDGRTHFYYPYSPNGGVKEVIDGAKKYKRPEDVGHSAISLRGALMIYDSAPDLGIDEEFLTAFANMLYHNATTKIRRDGRMVLSGHMEPPAVSAFKPHGSASGGHQYSPCRGVMYALEAFRTGLIPALGNPLSKSEQAEKNADLRARTNTLYSHYLKAFRKDRSIIHLAEK